MHLPVMKIETDAIQSAHTREAFGDVTHFKKCGLMSFIHDDE
jgi:hypothetical protein